MLTLGDPPELLRVGGETDIRKKIIRRDITDLKYNFEWNLFILPEIAYGGDGPFDVKEYDDGVMYYELGDAEFALFLLEFR